MTGPDNFLSRWSRRKQDAAKDAAVPVNEKAEDARATTDATGEHETAARPGPKQAEPVFDLSKLPSLDSIGPDTDIRLFMQPGVPAALSRAALRRAWSADPAIRDFIGLSENSWDFTAPNSATGFGPLLPTDDIKRMLAEVFNEPATEENKADEAAAAALQQPDKPAEPSQDLAVNLQTSAVQAQSAKLQTSSPDEGKTALQCSIDDVARQQEEPSEAVKTNAIRRRHGGALPT